MLIPKPAFNCSQVLWVTESFNFWKIFGKMPYATQLKNYLFLSLLILLNTSTSSMAQSEKDVINKFLRASGGANRWKMLTTRKSVGIMIMEGKKVPITVYQKRPDYLKTVLMIDGEEHSSVIKFEFETCFLDQNKIDHTFSNLGEVTFEGKNYYQVSITHEVSQGRNSLVEYYFFDKKTFLTKAIRWGTVGQPIEKYAITYFDDYRSVDSLMIPFHQEMKSSDGESLFNVYYNYIFINLPISAIK